MTTVAYCVGLPAWVELTHPDTGSRRWRIALEVDTSELIPAIHEACENEDCDPEPSFLEENVIEHFNQSVTGGRTRQEFSVWHPTEAGIHQHVGYPHEPGRLHDCPACMDRCHCIPGTTVCVYEGKHWVSPCPKGITDAKHWTCRSNPHLCRCVMSDLHSYDPAGDYTKACEQAADQQGVTPIVDALKAAGLDAVADQTGGMTMVAAVYGHTGYLWITSDDGYLLGWYPNDPDSYDGFYLTAETMDEVAIIARLLLALDDHNHDDPDRIMRIAKGEDT